MKKPYSTPQMSRCWTIIFHPRLCIFFHRSYGLFIVFSIQLLNIQLYFKTNKVFHIYSFWSIWLANFCLLNKKFWIFFNGHTFIMNIFECDWYCRTQMFKHFCPFDIHIRKFGDFYISIFPILWIVFHQRFHQFDIKFHAWLIHSGFFCC